MGIEPPDPATASNRNVSIEQISVSLEIEKTGLSTMVTTLVIVSIHPLSLATIKVAL